MRKGLLIFVLLATTIAYSMDHETEISRALNKLDLVKIEELCNQGKIGFKKKYSTICQLEFCISALHETPFNFAVCRNNLDLADLFIRYGAEPAMQTYSKLSKWGSYQFLPILYKYHPNVECQVAGGNLLHWAVDCCRNKEVHKLIAGILLFFPDYSEQKSYFSNGSHEQYQIEQFTPLEYAKSGWGQLRDSAQRAIEILENKELLKQTMNEVDSEFKLQAIKKLGMHSYLQGRELGMSLYEVQQQRNFEKGNSLLLENTKKEEE